MRSLAAAEEWRVRAAGRRARGSFSAAPDRQGRRAGRRLNHVIGRGAIVCSRACVCLLGRRAGLYDKALFGAVAANVSANFTKFETEQLLKARLVARGEGLGGSAETG